MDAAGPTPSCKASRKAPGRKRRWVGWVMLVLGVVVTGVWVASGWWWSGYNGRFTQVFVARGTVFVYQRDFVDPTVPQGWSTARMDAQWEWTVTSTFDDLGFAYQGQPNSRVVNGRIAGYMRFSGYRCVLVTLWPVCLLLLCSGSVMLWSARRARRRGVAGVCVKCGYSLAGLPAGASCPECGREGTSAVTPA
ncbi:MAG: hypothetical protein ACREJO_12335 [Phycisphaerales bacterium]